MTSTRMRGFWPSIVAVVALYIAVFIGARNPSWGVLPEWLQAVAWCLPTAPVFEGMRAILMDGQVRPDLLVHAILLDLVYLAIGAGLFLYSFQVARRRGLLLQVGE